jgi:hypothetical protein
VWKASAWKRTAFVGSSIGTTSTSVPSSGLQSKLSEKEPLPSSTRKMRIRIGEMKKTRCRSVAMKSCTMIGPGRGRLPMRRMGPASGSSYRSNSTARP